MAESSARTKQQLKSLTLLCVAVLSALIPCAIALPETFELLNFLYFDVIATLVVIGLMLFAAIKKSRKAGAVLVVYCVVSWLCWRDGYALRTHERWLLGAEKFKGEVLSQPDSRAGELKHVEWDGWGGFGAGDTNVYLVFDPSDSLLAVPIYRTDRHFKGVPCQVSRAYRLERRWYSLIFYTDTDWEHCL